MKKILYAMMILMCCTCLSIGGIQLMYTQLVVRQKNIQDFIGL